MNDKNKAYAYDELIRESDIIQRENSKLKSQYIVNVPKEIQQKIDSNNNKIAGLLIKLENLFK